MKRRYGAAGAVVLALALTACSGGEISVLPSTSVSGSQTASPSGPPSASVDPGDLGAPDGLEDFYAQNLAWTDCGDNQCATLTVPLDYDDPTGETIDLDVLKHDAEDTSQGSIVVNPGGPGGSGVDMASMAGFYLSGSLLDHFDIVGFDPRGVGTIDCATDQQLDAILAADPAPRTLVGWRGLLQIQRAFGAGCSTRSGALAAHVSTVEAARDMDVLRAALREPKLDYYGASYGTKLGSTYASLFPDRVGHLVLDGAIDPAVDSFDSLLEQSKGFDTAMTAYLTDCVQGGDCFLGDTVDQARSKVESFLDGLATAPLPTSSGRDLTQGLAVYGIITPLYDRTTWSYLTAGLKQGIESGSGDTLLLLADSYSSRQADGSYSSNLLEANLAINCLDDPTSYPLPEILKARPQFVAESPVFGKYTVSGLAACIGFKERSSFDPVTIAAPDADPIVVIGTTRDPATPYQWAVGLTKALQSAVLITRDGDGHTGYNKGNDCVDEAVDAYFIDGTIPPADLQC